MKPRLWMIVIRLGAVTTYEGAEKPPFGRHVCQLTPLELLAFAGGHHIDTVSHIGIS